ncbi:NAD(P)-dependent oxidoreductase [Streptomyces prunicolor]|uniref:NAD(P)-dependent oxidoreductase n=1 Tax=Streptomyces prunicolor TaxID=67348 RepID=UPI0003AA8B10|nr:NAD(P)-dependent oxidoreductase [Streptomyces prunicolor]
MADTARETVVVVGLGNMGLEIAINLVRNGYRVAGCDPDPQRRALADRHDEIDTFADPSELPASDTVVLSLPSPAVSMKLIETLGPRLGGRTVFVETSTVGPHDMVAFGEACDRHGVKIIDAAVMAGVEQMKAGRAVLLVGGDPAVIEHARPVLDAFSRRVTVFGGLGSGMAAKVINNAVAHALMVVFVEAGAMATSAGIATDTMLTLLTDAEMGIHRPLTHRYAERVRRGDFEGGMPISAARKDSTLALDLAQRLQVPIFAIQAAQSVYDLALASGYSDLDYSAIARLWEVWGTPAAQGLEGTPQ